MAVAEELPEPVAALVADPNGNKAAVVVLAVETVCDAAGAPIPKAGLCVFVSAAVDVGAEALEDVVC